jgi:hypothetical protein
MTNIVVKEIQTRVITVNNEQSKLIVINKGPKGDVGEQGPTGLTGPAGATGATGVGIPTGGTVNQVLTKNSNSDYDTEWTNGGDLLSSNNLSDVANAKTARENLGAITNTQSIINSLIFG